MTRALKAAKEITQKWTVSEANSDGYPKFIISAEDIARIISKHFKRKKENE